MEFISWLIILMSKLRITYGKILEYIIGRNLSFFRKVISMEIYQNKLKTPEDN